MAKPRRREQREAEERDRLATYAVASVDSRGRRHAEPAHPVRLCFERDRDRIAFSRCFRRLEYKTQVFVEGTADHYRTRMTHTIEVAVVSRTLARYFRVNEDLCEAIALAHDIGHPPFGHCGERTLDALMRDRGGFDHNRQSLRWVDELEEQYPGFRGLNLTWEVRAGLMKHACARPGAALDGHPVGPHQAVEAQITDMADDITYCAHDVDDALEAGLLREEDFAQEPLWQEALRRTTDEYTDLSAEQRRRITVRNLLDLMASDLMEVGREKLGRLRPVTVQDVMAAPERVIALSPDMDRRVASLKRFLFERFYGSAEVRERSRQGTDMMKRLFAHYLEHPETMGRKARRRIAETGLARTVCDYLSGFTDRYAFAEYRGFALGPLGPPEEG